MFNHLNINDVNMLYYNYWKYGQMYIESLRPLLLGETSTWDETRFLLRNLLSIMWHLRFLSGDLWQIQNSE